MFRTQWEEHNNYKLIRLNSYQWLVFWIYGNASLIPQFHQKYGVKRQKGYFTCSSKNFELHGFSCRHVLVVLSSCYDYTEPNHPDFTLCHWKEFHYYSSLGSPTSCTSMLQENFDTLPYNDVSIFFLRVAEQYFFNPIYKHIINFLNF